MSTNHQQNQSLPKILVSVLTTYERHGWPTKHIAEWIEYLRLRGADLPFAVKILFAHNFCPAASARNSTAKVFMNNTDAEWLMMIDNDMTPPERILDCVLSAPDDADVVVPRFWIWDANIGAPVLAWGVLSVDPNQSEIDELFIAQGFTELRKCGTGCIFIRRSAFEKIDRYKFEELNPSSVPVSDDALGINGTGMPYFWYPYTSEGAQAATEDIMFCEKLRAAGGKIYGNGDFEVGHYHNIDISQVAKAVYYRKDLTTGVKIVPEAEESPSEASATAVRPT